MIARIADQDAEFLRYSTERALVQGALMVVERVDPIGDSIQLVVGERTLALGRTAAKKILVLWD